MTKKKIRMISYLFIGSILLSPISILALTKSETIYTTLNKDGSTTKSQVVSHITNEEEQEIEDETKLKEILNIKGKETYTLDNNLLKWQALGKDIYYQGETNNTLPIQTKITYYLNNEEKTLEEIKGKEGHIEIKLDFDNQDKKQVKVNGIEEEIRTPFVVSIGTVLSNADNKNITINHGKVVDTGTRNIVIGLATPGLYESIGYSELQGMNSISISFDTTSFSLNSIYIVATPKLLEETDLEIFDKVTILNSNMEELKNGVNSLQSGAEQLLEGAKTVNIGEQELLNGIKNLSSAITQLESGTIEIKEGISKVNQILTGLLKTLEDKNLPASISSLQTLKETNENMMQGLIIESGKGSLESLQQYYGMNQLNSYQGQDNDSEKMLAKVCMEQYTLLSKNNEALTLMINSLTDLGNQIEMMKTYTNQISLLETGAVNLANGMSEVKLGIQKLEDGASKLANGTMSLQQGAATLSDGVKTLNETGIKKLTTYTSTITNYSNKLEALVELSKGYSGFTSNNANTTTFISMVKETK